MQARAVQEKKDGKQGWGDMPHVNQLWPKGADKSQYVNGAYNCAAAVVAMLTRGHGKKPGLSDAQLITHLSRGNVTDKGSTPNDVAAMMERAGVPRMKPALGGPFDSARVKDQLGKGRMLIAQVGVRDKQTKELSAHYVVIKKMTADGNFVISDPLKKKSTVVSPQQLAKAVNQTPPHGGVMIPVGRPGGDLKPETPPPLHPQEAVDPWAFHYAQGPAALMRLQPFQAYPADPRMDNGFTGDRIEGRQAVYPNGFTPSSTGPLGSQVQLHGRPGYSTQDQFMADPRRRMDFSLLGGVPSQPMLMPAEPRPAKPPPKSTTDKNAFLASDAEFKGVKKDFVPTDAGATSRKRGGKPRVDISYSLLGDTLEPPKKPMTPRRLSAQQYGDMLLKAVDNKKKGMAERLARLELSPFKRDKEVMAYIEDLLRNQGGIGKKINVEYFG
jgi:hypothetical protein